MGKCSTHCLHPELPLEASHHRCHNCKQKFHALCSSVRHPRADALGLGLGNDILCPTCAGFLAENLRQASRSNLISTPISAPNSSDEESVITTPSTNDLLVLADRAAQIRSVGTTNHVPKQHLYPIHPLPPGVTISNSAASDESKCQFTKQYKCKYKQTPLVYCANENCTNPVHVQCFLNLILSSEDKSKKVCF
jgi:hypothetical protein